MATMDARLATRWIVKPLVFLSCLLPAGWLLAGLADWPAASLGANPIEKIQDTLGIWGLRLLLTTLAVTPLSELMGWPRLMGFRRMLGLFAFFYISMHFLFYLLVDQSLDWRVLFEDIAKRPYITVGFSALLLLVPLAVTSTKRAMRRLGRRWQRLHRLVYPAAILGCTHFFWQVKADIREPLVYIGVLAVLLGWRLYRHRRLAAAKAVVSGSAALAGRGRAEQYARQYQQTTRAGLPVEPLPE
jgi:sulfoxide reductase heme-binding subunit YedZ